MARNYDLNRTGAAFESVELFRLLVESVMDYAIFALDATGHVVTWNAGAERIKGYTREEIVGLHFSTFYPEEDRLAGKPDWELRVAAEEGRVEDEGWRIRKDGTRFWANVVITALRAPDGSLMGYAKVTRDLTERKASEERAREDAARLAAEEAGRTAAEQRARALGELLDRLQEQAEELEQRRAEAEEANRAKSAFLAAMSHELRTPLNAIAGYTDLMLLGIRGPLTPDQIADLERVRRSGRHLLALIDDVLNFVPLEAGSVTYDLRPVRVADVLDIVLGMVDPQSAGKTLEFAVHPCGPEVSVTADRDRFAQILINLLVNAIKFTPAEGRITLACESAGEDVLVRVSDTGPGIDPARLEAIFEPFVQLDTGLTRAAQGIGLGLSISRELARGMGGELTVASEVGEGSTFTLRLRRTS